MFKITCLVLEKDYDPGFTLVANIDAKRLEADFYTREKDGIIRPVFNEDRPMPNYNAEQLRVYMQELHAHAAVGGIKHFMDTLGEYEQIRWGWRAPIHDEPRPIRRVSMTKHV